MAIRFGVVCQTFSNTQATENERIVLKDVPVYNNDGATEEMSPDFKHLME